MNVHRLPRWLGFLFAGSVAVYLAANLVLDRDESRLAIERFLASDAQVKLRVGTMKQAELVKRVSVGASGTSKAHRLYTFAVNGETGKATVVVRAEESDGETAHENFLVTEFK